MKSRTHVTAKPKKVEDDPVRYVSKDQAKSEFGRRLYRMMVEADFTQSDLARKAGMARNNVSTYIRGRSLPEPTSLKALAKALNVSPEELLPDYIESAIDADNPEVEMKVSAGAPDKAWLRVNRLVSTVLALKILNLINDAKASD